MRRIAAVCLFAATLSVTHAADRFALARSSGEFELKRAGDVIAARPDVLTTVKQGDTLIAGTRALQMDLANGASLALGPYSALEVLPRDEVSIKRGHAAISARNSALAGMRYENLRITLAPGNDAGTGGAEPTLIGVAVLDENRVRAVASNGTFIVSHVGDVPEQDRTVGVVGSGDAVLFVRRGSEWIVMPEQVGQPPQAPGTATASESATQDDDDDDAGAWWWAGAGAAAVAAGGLIYYLWEDDEDDDHRDNKNNKKRNELEEGRDGDGRGPGDGEGGRPPFSIIAPPFGGTPPIGPPFGIPPRGGTQF